MSSALDQSFSFFLDSQFADYKEGEWVAIYNDKVISHDMHLEQVVKEAKKIAPISKVLLSKIKKTASYL